MDKKQEGQDKSKGIIALVIAIIGILVLFKVSAILGGLVYLISFGFSLYVLKSKVDYSATFSIMYFTTLSKSSCFAMRWRFTISRETTV